MTVRAIKVKGEKLSILAHSDSAEKLITGTDTGDNGTAGEALKVKGTYLYWTDNNGDIRRKEGILTGNARDAGDITVHDRYLYYGDDDGNERSAGQVATQTLRPNAAGDLTDIANQFPNSDEHWDKVDEASADDDTTYVDNETVGLTTNHDIYNLEDFSGSGLITNVRVYVRWKQFGVNALWPFGILLKTYTTLATWNFFGIGATYEESYRDWATNPHTDDAWTVAEINALQAGVTLWGSSTLWGRCTQIYVVVTYE